MYRYAESPDPFGLASTPSAYVARASTERAMRALDGAIEVHLAGGALSYGQRPEDLPSRLSRKDPRD